MSDILIPINDDEQLSELCEMYKMDSTAPPYVYSFLETMKKWKGLGKNELMKLWSPNECWREDGTFIALLQFGNYDLFMFTLDPECKNLRKGIAGTKRMNWKQPAVLFNVNARHYPYVLEAFRAVNLVANFNIIHDMYLFEREEALVKFNNIECPSEVCLKELDVSAAPVIDSLCKVRRHRYPDGHKYIATLIELNGGFGLFSKESGELVAWVMRTCLGQIGFLQTIDEHSGKGYAKFLTKVVARKIAEEGFVPMAAISKDKVAALNLFRKLGFQQDGVCYFLEVNK